jgi:hypothetical protein
LLQFMLEKDTSRRPQDPAALLAALRAVTKALESKT